MSFHAAANSSEDILAVFAHVARFSSLSATDLSISLMTVEMAVPPASALMPSDVSAPARPSTSALDSPIDLPAPAILMAIAEMSDSVVARLLPKPTIVDPNRSVFSLASSMMLKNWASSVPACSALMLVAMSRPLTTSPNSWISLLPLLSRSSV